MVHKIKRQERLDMKQGMFAWRCAFCGKGFGNIYERDQHEVHCHKRKKRKKTPQGRRVGTAW